MKFSNQNRNRIIALLSMLAAGILIGQIFSTAERTVQAKVQKELADEVLRFHVLANSDSTLDQEMKLCVRNEKKELQTQVIAYAKTKPARDGLKAQKTEKARRNHPYGKCTERHGRHCKALFQESRNGSRKACKSSFRERLRTGIDRQPEL